VSAPGWPLLLADGPVGVRPLRLRDATAWSSVRTANEEWLTRWEGRPPRAAEASWAERHTPGVFSGMLRGLRREARAGRTLPCAITYEGRLAGQVTVGNVVRGAFDSGYVGYWVDGRLAGRGIAPTAVALIADHCFTAVGLHRVEANVRPENGASLRVLDKLGFSREALHRRYLYIDGDWRDHVGFSLLREDVPEGVLRRYLARHAG
jgi:ribosomal-protein-alanine N-acetyltransferase